MMTEFLLVMKALRSFQNWFGSMRLLLVLRMLTHKGMERMLRPPPPFRPNSPKYSAELLGSGFCRDVLPIFWVSVLCPVHFSHQIGHSKAGDLVMGSAFIFFQRLCLWIENQFSHQDRSQKVQKNSYWISNHRRLYCEPGHIPLDHCRTLTYHCSGTMYRPRDEFFFRKFRDVLRFNMILTTQQPKGRCFWGLGPRSRPLGSCFAEKSVCRNVLPNCWDFFAEMGGGAVGRLGWALRPTGGVSTFLAGAYCWEHFGEGKVVGCSDLFLLPSFMLFCPEPSPGFSVPPQASGAAVIFADAAPVGESSFRGGIFLPSVGRGDLGLTHTETQRGRLWTACGQRRVDSKNSQTTPATTSTSSICQLLGVADAQTAHHATFSTAPTHQPLGSANAETTPAGAPAAAADRTQRPDATCEGKNG